MAVKPPIFAKDYLFGESELDVFSSQMSVLGPLLHGQTSDLVGYIHPPRYRAFRFAAAQYDRIDVWVRSEDGDAVAWVLDTNYQTLAWNDDAHPGTTDAHIVLTIPSSQPVFYIVFREYSLAFSHFRVRLKWEGRQLTPGPTGDAHRPGLAALY